MNSYPLDNFWSHLKSDIRTTDLPLIHVHAQSVYQKRLMTIIYIILTTLSLSLLLSFTRMHTLINSYFCLCTESQHWYWTMWNCVSLLYSITALSRLWGSPRVSIHVIWDFLVCTAVKTALPTQSIYGLGGFPGITPSMLCNIITGLNYYAVLST